MLNQLTGGLWGAVPRRFHEAAARTLPFMALAFLPVLLGVGDALPVGRAPRRPPTRCCSAKAAYLNAAVLRRPRASSTSWSGACSRTCSAAGRGSRTTAPDRARAARLRGLSGVGLVLLSGTTTFAAIDWGMSLAPHWFSTIYGVLFIVGWSLTALSFTIVLLARVAGEAPFDAALRPVTVHDLGKLLLAFTMLWAYVNFSQFLIIWSGNISEETPFYLRRLQGGWQVLAIGLLVFHFALPFALLLSRPLKRNARSLAAVAWLMLLMQVVDLYWLIVPDLAAHEAAAPLPRPLAGPGGARRDRRAVAVPVRPAGPHASRPAARRARGPRAARGAGAGGGALEQR